MEFKHSAHLSTVSIYQFFKLLICQKQCYYKFLEIGENRRFHMLDPIKATVPLKTRFLQYNSTTEEYFKTNMVCIDLLHPWDDGLLFNP